MVRGNPLAERRLELVLLPESFAVVRLGPDAAVPEWAGGGNGALVSITRTAEELSIVRAADFEAALAALAGAGHAVRRHAAFAKP